MADTLLTSRHVAAARRDPGILISAESGAAYGLTEPFDPKNDTEAALNAAQNPPFVQISN